MPLDDAVRQAVCLRKPFVLDKPKSKVTLCIRDLAHKLDLERQDASRQSLLWRLATWLAG
ncbi:MAG: hypothetical protein R3236_07490, partial [Phycisphaeraceae bacterium]|nr:hypothetical protein [Phycisphaeraceae bacterium]